MPDLGGRELLREWEKVTSAVIDAATSMARNPDLSRRTLEPLQRQLALLQAAVERERRMQKQIAAQFIAPVDAVFDLLEDSAAMLHRQAEALSVAGRALEDAAALIETEAELFERTLATMRRPANLAKTIAGVDARPPKKRVARKPPKKAAGRQPSRSRQSPR